MKKLDFIIEGPFIELNSLLKVCRIANSGGMANEMISNGEVKVDGVTDTRKRAKIRPGMVVTAFGTEIVCR